MVSLEIRNKLIQYIDEEITLEQLEDWLVPNLPKYLKYFDSTDSDIISAVELGLAEINNRNWTEEKLRSYLSDALLELIVLIHFDGVQDNAIISGSSNKTSGIQFSNASFEYSMTRI